MCQKLRVIKYNMYIDNNDKQIAVVVVVVVVVVARERIRDDDI